MQNIRKVLLLVENSAVPHDPRVWGEATALREAGYEVSVISLKSTVDTIPDTYECREGIHVYRFELPSARNKYLAYFLEYGVSLVLIFLLSLKVWRRHGFDVIHTANPPDIFFLIGLFYRCFGKKFIFDQHDISPELFQVIFQGRAKPLYRLLLWLERCSYQCADLVITANESFRQLAIQRGHCRPEKVLVVRNGPRLRRYETFTLDSDPPLPNRRRYLLAYIGAMNKQDGVENAIYALHQLVAARGRHDVSMVFMGMGKALPELQALVHQLGLDDYVFFTGWLDMDKALSYLKIADVGLVPDPQNGLNEFCTMIKVMEYMAMSLPVVGFDLLETRVSAQDAALYARPNEVEDFARQIELLLDNAELRQTMGAYGRARVVEQLSWAHSRKRLLAAYEMLFSGTKEAILDNTLVPEALRYGESAGNALLPKRAE